MIIEHKHKRKYKQISITIDPNTLATLETQRQIRGIPISTNLVKAFNDRENLKENVNQLLQKLNDKSQLLQNQLLLIEKKDKENLEAKQELNKYQKQKDRKYFQRLIRAIFNIID